MASANASSSFQGRCAARRPGHHTPATQARGNSACVGTPACCAGWLAQQNQGLRLGGMHPAASLAAHTDAACAPGRMKGRPPKLHTSHSFLASAICSGSVLSSSTSWVRACGAEARRSLGRTCGWVQRVGGTVGACRGKGELQREREAGSCAGAVAPTFSERSRLASSSAPVAA